jgi:CRP/FNR family transcriptional regulator, dissimilatory nitrate respiration regulator
MNLLTFDDLPPDLRSAIATRELVPEQILFRQGDYASALFIVKTGRLKVARLTSEQRWVTLQIARPNESFGEAAIVSEFYPYTAIAEINSQVVVYPQRTLLLALQHNPDLAQDLMARLIRKNLALMTQLELRDIRSAHWRVLHYLRYLTKPDYPQLINFDRPLKSVATDLGLAPATLSRALTRLEREGIIVREQNSIKLQDLPVL